MIKKICIVLLCVSWAVICQAEFVPGTEDIPAMDDMVFSEDMVSFDVPEGQILVAAATTQSSEKAIHNFYRESLNALGWNMVKPGVYMRGKDRLDVTVQEGVKERQVKFNLALFNN